jgi:transposase
VYTSGTSEFAAAASVSAPAASTPFGAVPVSVSKEEFIQLKWDADYWKMQHQRAVARIDEQKVEIEDLQAQLRDLRQRYFGRRSEKRGAGIESPAAQASHRRRGQRRGQPGHGRTSQADLPVREEIVDLDSGERLCPDCGLPLVVFPGTEDSEVVEVEVKAYRRRIRRRRYRPDCACGTLPGIVTAPAPARLIRKGRLGISVWVEVLLEKYLYARPTNRLLQAWGNLGLNVSHGTIIGGLKQIAPLFSPVMCAMVERQLTDGYCHADETGWRVFEPIPGKIGYRWYLWLVCSQSAQVFRMELGRSASVPLEHFATLLVQTILVCDRYSAYKKAARIIGLLLAFCWAHVRRDFLELARGYPELDTWARSWVGRIGTLYHLNHCRLQVKDDPVSFALRDEEVRAHLQDMAVERDRASADAQLHRAARKVMTSLNNHWEGLTVFVEHPEVRMDNNEAERNLRNEVLGRKNYYGSGPVWAAQLAATLFSILMTLVHCWGINPRRWMVEYLQACAENGQQPPQDLSRFLPWAMDPARLSYLRSPAPPTDNANST